MWTRTGVVAGRRVIALDGKTVRGARIAKTLPPHLVGAFDHTSGAVLGQVAAAAKSNEIPAVRDLLACFDLTGAVVTLDAMHTQRDTATAITSAGGDYLFTVKKNQPAPMQHNVPARSGTGQAGFPAAEASLKPAMHQRNRLI